MGESYSPTEVGPHNTESPQHVLSLTIEVPPVVPPVSFLCIVLCEEDHLSHATPQQLQRLNRATRLTEVL